MYNVSAKSACKSKAYLGLVALKDNHQSESHIDVSSSIRERNFDLVVSNTAQKGIVCKLINTTFLFTIDRFKNCVEFVNILQVHFITS